MADDVIYSYTDEQAVEDGFIHKLVANHRITSNAFNSLKNHFSKEYPTYNEGDYIRFFTNELIPLIPYAHKKWNEGSILKTDFYFKVGEWKHSKVLWFIPNEIGGITIMLPEDY